MARPTTAQRQAQARQAERETGIDDGCADIRPAAPSLTEAPPYDRLLTIDQVSDWLRVPKGTLYQWRSRDRGPRAIKVGNAVRYQRSDVAAYLARNTDAPLA